MNIYSELTQSDALCQS